VFRDERKLLFPIVKPIFSENEEDFKLFLIISAKLKIKGKRNGKDRVGNIIVENAVVKGITKEMCY